MNNIIFLLHLGVIVSFVLLCLKMGKEALFLFCAFCAVFANIFVTKQIELFSLTVTASDAYAVGALLGLNLIREFFGKEAAVKSIKITLLSLLFYLIITQLHLIYIPSSFDETQKAFEKI